MSPSLLSIMTVIVYPVKTKAERLRWDRLIDDKHYLHSHRMVGEQIRYAAIDGTGKWLALLGWCAGCDRLRGREEWIGWDDGQRRTRLHLVACNARFLMLGDRGEYPNLASKILSTCLSRISADWEERYGHPVLVAETFVDLKRRHADGTVEEIAEENAGICYRAVGFTPLGQTRGFRRTNGGFTRHGIQRLLLAREIVPEARALLCSLQTSWDRGERAKPANQVNLLNLPAAFAPEHGLVPHLLKHVPDPRKRKQYRWSCILIGLMGGILAGETTVKGVAAWARALPEEIIARIGGRLKKGHRSMPVANTYRYALENADLDAFTTAIRSWLADNDIDWKGELIHVDGKTLNGSARNGKLIHTAAAFVGAHRALISMATHAGDEREAVRKCLKQLDLRGCTVTGDALQTDLDTTLVIEEKGGITCTKSRPINPRFCA